MVRSACAPCLYSIPGISRACCRDEKPEHGDIKRFAVILNEKRPGHSTRAGVVGFVSVRTSPVAFMQV